MEYRRDMAPDVERDMAELPVTPESVAARADAGSDPVTACLSFLAQRHERPSSPVILREGIPGCT